MWHGRYVCSSLTNNIGKEILERFRYPVTLTVAQFGFIGMFTYIYSMSSNRASCTRRAALVR